MTAINIILRRDRVTIATDSAFYDPTCGTLLGLGSKAHVLAHWPGLIAVRGPSYAAARLVAEANYRFANLDDFADGAPDFLADFAEEHAHLLGSWGEPAGLQVAAAGFSAARKSCRAFMIQLGEAPMMDGEHALLASGGESTILTNQVTDVPVDEIAMTPFLGQPEREAVGIASEIDVAQLDMPAERRLAVKVLNGQRLLSGAAIPGEAPFHFVGGRPLFATVFRDGTITTSAGPAWPDRLGEPIDPARDGMD